MNWIKSNPFVSALAGITLLLCAALYFVASKGAKKYEDAKSEFDEAFQSVSKSESIPLYPTAINRDGKRKALGEYRDSIEQLSNLYDPYRAGELVTVSPEDFTAHLKAATGEVSKAFESAGATIPDSFLMGYDKYASGLATEKATGVLEYQLKGLKHALLELADARPSELLGVFREPLPEEDGGQSQTGPNDVARAFGYEVTFKGSEEAARKFISSLGKTEPSYFIVRCLKIVNDRDDPPRVADAKFEKIKVDTSSAQETDNPFGGAFVLPGEEPAAKEEAAAPAKEEEPAAEIEVEVSTDSSRILAQVLGSEEVTVFVRFDLMMFLPSKELPKP